MALIPNAAEVVVKQRLFGQDVLNVWHVQVSATPDVAELSAIASAFQVGYAGLLGSLSADLTLVEIHVKDIGTLAGVEFTLSVVPADAGDITTESMPGGTAFCLSLRTALGGRRFRGRKYIAGIPRSEVSGNSFTLDFHDALLTSAGELLDGLIALGNPISVASFTGLTLTPVTAIVAADLDVDSQRRRLNNRGT